MIPNHVYIYIFTNWKSLPDDIAQGLDTELSDRWQEKEIAAAVRS